MAEWLADCCLLSPHARATAADLWDSYSAYANGKPDLSRTAFGRRLTEMGAIEDRVQIAGRTSRIRVGIGLLREGGE